MWDVGPGAPGLGARPRLNREPSLRRAGESRKLERRRNRGKGRKGCCVKRCRKKAKKKKKLKRNPWGIVEEKKERRQARRASERDREQEAPN